MLDFEYTKNHYRLIAIALRRQKELDADQKAIQKMKLLDNCGGSMFVLTILEKVKEIKLKISEGSVTVL